MWGGWRCAWSLISTDSLAIQFGSSAYAQKILYEKLSTPKDGGSFTLESLTKRILNKNSTNLLGLCIAVARKIKLRDNY